MEADMADNMERTAFRVISETWPIIDDGILRSAAYYKRLGGSFEDAAVHLEGYTRDGYIVAQDTDGMLHIRDRIAGIRERELDSDVRDAISRLVCDLSLEGSLLESDGSNADEAFWSTRMLEAMAVVAGHDKAMS